MRRKGRGTDQGDPASVRGIHHPLRSDLVGWRRRKGWVGEGKSLLESLIERWWEGWSLERCVGKVERGEGDLELCWHSQLGCVQVEVVVQHHEQDDGQDDGIVGDQGPELE